MILDIGFETMPREDLETIILRRLKTTIDRIYANVPFYRRKLEENNITPNDIRSLEDLQRIRLQPKRICAIIILTECLLFPWTTLFVFMLRPEPPVNRP